jgi:outer membrane receptor protein involved in Fe transport
VKNAGFDFSADYRFRDVLGGDVSIGGNATYIQKYKVGARPSWRASWSRRPSTPWAC